MKTANYARYSITTIVLATLLSFPLLGAAADKAGQYRVSIHSSEQSCGTYISARDESRRGDYIRQNKYQSWLAGYVTAYNRTSSDTYNILGLSDFDSSMLWLENYCKQNPLNTFVEAVDELLAELYPKRVRQAPKGN